jgi:hypothetical protein
VTNSLVNAAALLDQVSTSWMLGGIADVERIERVAGTGLWSIKRGERRASRQPVLALSQASEVDWVLGFFESIEDGVAYTNVPTRGMNPTQCIPMLTFQFLETQGDLLKVLCNTLRTFG